MTLFARELVDTSKEHVESLAGIKPGEYLFSTPEKRALKKSIIKSFSLKLLSLNLDKNGVIRLELQSALKPVEVYKRF